MHKTLSARNTSRGLLARNTSRGTLALTVVFRSITDSKRERRMLLLYIKKIILSNTVCCKYELLVALGRFHASSGKIMYIISFQYP